MTLPQESVSINEDDNFPVWHETIKRLNFKKRICTAFISQEINKEHCICNNPHHESDVFRSNGIWKWKDHSKPEATKCYGILPDLKKPFLRCDVETELEQLCLVLLGVWCMPMPSMIIQMIGDAASTLNFKLEKELLHGVSDAAVASDAWILTSGYKEEAISELIGEIVYKNQLKNAKLNFSAIAVGKWGNIAECRELEKKYVGEKLQIQIHTV